MSSVAVIDYGMGNLHSVASALRKIDPEADVVITSDAQTILRADRVIFPGVGAIRDCMAEILRLGIDKVVRDVIASGKPLLAICVGMQALMQHSEENNGVDCLSILPGHVKFFGDPLQRCERRKTQSAAHGLESGASNALRIRCGMASRRTAVFISCTVFIFTATSPSMSPRRRNTACNCTRRSRTRICSPCNFIRKKAAMPVCNC